MPLPFNTSLDIKLMKCVKENPILYNPNVSKYMDFNAREVAWQKIGDEIKRPARVCKARWINIRDMMRKKIRERIRNPDQRSYKYKYEYALEFMMPFFKESIAGSFNHQDDYTEFFEGEEDNPLSSCDVVGPPLYQNTESDNEDTEDVKPTLSKKKKKKRVEEIEMATFINDNINDSVAQELNPTDPLDVFLMTIGTTLRTFSPYYLNQAKSKIFTVVQEYELQQIVDKNGQPPGTGGGS